MSTFNSASFNIDIPYDTAVFLEDINIYLINPNGRIIRDGIAYQSTYQVKVLAVDSLDGFYTETSETVIKFYKVLKNGRVCGTISADEYNQKLSEIMATYADKHGVITSDEGQREHRNFVNTHTPEKEHVTSKKEYKFKVIGSIISDCGSPYIQCLLTNSGKLINGHLYSLNLRKIETDTFKKVKDKFTNVTFDVPTHSYMQYVKANGKYIFDDGWSERRQSVFYGSLDDCKKKEQEYTQSIEQFMITRIRSFMIRANTLDDVTLSTLIDNAKSVVAKISIIPYRDTVKGHEAYRNAVKQATDFKDMLVALADKYGDE